MAKTANLNIRIDPDTKAQAERLYSQFGITITDAVNMFLSQSVIYGGLPFELKLNKPNADTIAALEEAERISRDSNVKGYTNVDEMMKELLD
ncbi:MAG: type II toxin-antitoxin system RelB/DinJ family antitoxin [Hydrogenoanaerobacterium sp.]